MFSLSGRTRPAPRKSADWGLWKQERLHNGAEHAQDRGKQRDHEYHHDSKHAALVVKHAALVVEHACLKIFDVLTLRPDNLQDLFGVLLESLFQELWRDREGLHGERHRLYHGVRLACGEPGAFEGLGHVVELIDLR